MRCAVLLTAVVVSLAWAAAADASEGVYVTNINDAGTVTQYTIGAGGTLTPDSTATVAAGEDPYGVVVSPNGLYAYVANDDADVTNGISQYTVGAGGTLIPDSTPTVDAGNGPTELLVSPNGLYLYAINLESTGTDGLGLSQYTIGSGGMLTPDSIPTVTTGEDPEGIAMSPNGQYVYVANGDSSGAGGLSQYTVGAGGMLTPDSTPTVDAGDTPAQIAVSPNGNYVYVADSGSNGTDGAGVSQYTVGAGGMLTPDSTPTVGAGDEPSDVAVSPNGEDVYVSNFGSTSGADGISQYTIGAGGMLTPDSTPTVTTGDEPNGIALSPDGQYLYVPDSAFGSDTSTVSQYTVGAGGMLAPDATPTVAGGESPASIAVAPDSGPVAAFTAAPQAAGDPSAFASMSTDTDEPITAEAWSFGDGTTGTGAAVSHTYAKPGAYTVTLTTVDLAGCTYASPYFAGEAGPFTGLLSACSPDPAATMSQTVTIPAPPPGSAALAKVSVKGSSVSVTVSCTGTAAQTCAGTAALVTVEHLSGKKVTELSAVKKKKPKKSKKTVTLAHASYSLSAGTTKRLTFTLGKTGKSLLVKFHKLPAKLTITPAGSKTASATKNVTFKSKAKAKKHKKHH